jgi:hypothetical protein
MNDLQPESRVKLRQPIPELDLPGGAIGTVCSTWCSPMNAYEVEFRRIGLTESLRVLLLEHQLDTLFAY